MLIKPKGLEIVPYELLDIFLVLTKSKTTNRLIGSQFTQPLDFLAFRSSSSYLSLNIRSKHNIGFVVLELIPSDKILV